MKRINQLIAIAMMMIVSATMAHAQAAQKKSNPQPPAAPAPAAVSGSGTTGQITKWTGVSGSSTYTLGDAGIFEDKFLNVGIGTTAPTSKLTVKGMIEIQLGGLKFPDGTVQTTAALSTIFHDATLAGNGTAASPLGVANGGIGTIQLANNAVTASKIAAGQVVKSLNGLYDDVTLAAGSNISLTQAGNTITINTTGAPVPVPLVVSGSVNQGGVISATNTAQYGFGLIAKGGRRSFSVQGGGVLAQGADNPVGGTDDPGVGLRAMGGFNHQSGPSYGTGVLAFGGGCDSVPDCTPSPGIEAMGGTNPNGGRGLAGQFQGDVRIAGALNVMGTKNFMIDHPLDPENKYLYHAAVESAEVLNLYSGNVTTDGNGDAVVQLPDWFEAINKDFRYQLTVIGSFAQAIVAEKVKQNRFTIRTSAANVEVSWQVTGVRSDPVMVKHPFKVEEDKTEAERGSYLSPDAYDLPEERGLEYVRNPDLVRQMKAAREKVQKRGLQ